MYYTINEAIENNSKVKQLNIDHTDPTQEIFEKIPFEIYTLTELQLLSIKRHQISQLDSNILSLKKLQILKLNGNLFDEIPQIVFQIENLIVLDLSKNNISKIPKEILKLKNLKYLIINGNKINQIPPFVFEMSYLEKLDLDKNPIPQREIIKLKNALPNTKIIFEFMTDIKE